MNCDNLTRSTGKEVDIKRSAVRQVESTGAILSLNHFANLLSHRSVKDSFNRKLTTIAERDMKSKYKEGKRAKRKKVDEFGVEKSHSTLSQLESK